MIAPARELSMKSRNMRVFLMKFLEQSSVLGISTADQDYGIDLGDGIGDLMLRFIVAFL
jgi:hypothetical protein